MYGQILLTFRSIKCNEYSFGGFRIGAGDRRADVAKLMRETLLSFRCERTRNSLLRYARN
jgi:hypothetical protein